MQAGCVLKSRLRFPFCRTIIVNKPAGPPPPLHTPVVAALHSNCIRALAFRCHYHRFQLAVILWTPDEHGRGPWQHVHKNSLNELCIVQQQDKADGALHTRSQHCKLFLPISDSSNSVNLASGFFPHWISRDSNTNESLYNGAQFKRSHKRR